MLIFSIFHKRIGRKFNTFLFKPSHHFLVLAADLNSSYMPFHHLLHESSLKTESALAQYKPLRDLKGLFLMPLSTGNWRGKYCWQYHAGVRAWALQSGLPCNPALPFIMDGTWQVIWHRQALICCSQTHASRWKD